MIYLKKKQGEQWCNTHTQKKSEVRINHFSYTFELTDYPLKNIEACCHELLTCKMQIFWQHADSQHLGVSCHETRQEESVSLLSLFTGQNIVQSNKKSFFDLQINCFCWPTSLRQTASIKLISWFTVSGSNPACDYTGLQVWIAFFPLINDATAFCIYSSGYLCLINKKSERGQMLFHSTV